MRIFLKDNQKPPVNVMMTVTVTNSFCFIIAFMAYMCTENYVMLTHSTTHYSNLTSPGSL